MAGNEWLCDRFNVAKPPLYFPNGFLRGSIPRWEQRKFREYENHWRNKFFSQKF